MLTTTQECSRKMPDVDLFSPCGKYCSRVYKTRPDRRVQSAKKKLDPLVSPPTYLLVNKNNLFNREETHYIASHEERNPNCPRHEE